MSYKNQARMATDRYLRDRIAACAATQDIDEPLRWAELNQWALSAAPGWDEAYSYAIEVNHKQPNFEPGIDDAIINDQMILSAVQARIAEKQTPDTTESTEPTTI